MNDKNQAEGREAVAWMEPIERAVVNAETKRDHGRAWANIYTVPLYTHPQPTASSEALYRMFRALVDAGGPETIARHGVERGARQWANDVRAGMLAIEFAVHPERFDWDASKQPTDLTAHFPPAPTPRGYRLECEHGVDLPDTCAECEQPTDTEREWPKIGHKYLVKLNGVLQHEVYEFDQGDSDFGMGVCFWSRDDIDGDCPEFDPEKDQWIALDAIDATMKATGEG